MTRVKDLVAIVRRREHLIARCAAQRNAVAGVFRDLERPIAVADRALAVVRFFRAHPLLVLAAVAVVVGLRRRGVLPLAARALTAWRMWRGFSTWAGSMGMHFPQGRRREKTGDVAS